MILKRKYLDKRKEKYREKDHVRRETQEAEDQLQHVRHIGISLLSPSPSDTLPKKHNK